MRIAFLTPFLESYVMASCIFYVPHAILIAKTAESLFAEDAILAVVPSASQKQVAPFNMVGMVFSLRKPTKDCDLGMTRKLF